MRYTFLFNIDAVAERRKLVSEKYRDVIGEEA